MVMVTAVKNGYEDWLRHKADDKVNNQVGEHRHPVFIHTAVDTFLWNNNNFCAFLYYSQNIEQQKVIAVWIHGNNRVEN